ncbi:MAG: DUF4097 family beta strand repeat protein [Clostridia bacterium]|nr:DUF4097 family beta strand repeat protein [Clostridia bacterium]
MKKFGKALLAVAAALVLCAVVLGLLNGLIAKGSWTFGWLDYRYDQTGFETGGASVTSPNADQLKRIEIDWIDGSVQVIPCKDICVSMTESAQGELGDGNELTWKLSEDGTTLTVRYRKSSWFFQGTHKENKTLTLRVPERFFGQLEELDVNVHSSRVTVTGLTLSTVRFSADRGSLTGQDCQISKLIAKSQSGDVTWDGSVTDGAEVQASGGKVSLSSAVCPKALDVKTQSGDVTLSLPSDASFTMQWITKKGSLTSDLSLATVEDGYRYGEGTAAFRVETGKGDLLIKQYAPRS